MSASTSAPALECRSVSFRYPEGSPALLDVELAVAPGEFVALLAANGSGKTTLIKVLAGLLTPTAGTVLIDGIDIRQLPAKALYRRVGLLVQNPKDQLFGATVAEDVAFGPRNLALDEEQVGLRVNAALAAVGAAHLKSRAIHHLSFGEQKRVALAGVLAMRPAILLLDEATAGMDPAGEVQMIDFLNQLNREQGLTVIFATHSVDMLPLFAHRICVLEMGRVIRCAAPRKVFQDPDILARAGLRLPYISHLFDEMHRRDGFAMERLPLTVREARQSLLDMLAGAAGPDGKEMARHG
jgi:cobalt/nickel transport system ATP-binding protein